VALKEEAVSGPDKQKLSVQVKEECLEEARDAAFVEKALEAQIMKVRKKYTNGERLPERKGDLNPGRPLS
jgi:hypothetical protein